jgi:hypothetical protein
MAPSVTEGDNVSVIVQEFTDACEGLILPFSGTIRIGFY